MSLFYFTLGNSIEHMNYDNNEKELDDDIFDINNIDNFLKTLENIHSSKFKDNNLDLFVLNAVISPNFNEKRLYNFFNLLIMNNNYIPGEYTKCIYDYTKYGIIDSYTFQNFIIYNNEFVEKNFNLLMTSVLTDYSPLEIDERYLDDYRKGFIKLYLSNPKKINFNIFPILLNNMNTDIINLNEDMRTECLYFKYKYTKEKNKNIKFSDMIRLFNKYKDSKEENDIFIYLKENYNYYLLCINLNLEDVYKYNLINKDFDKEDVYNNKIIKHFKENDQYLRLNKLSWLLFDFHFHIFDIDFVSDTYNNLIKKYDLNTLLLLLSQNENHINNIYYLTHLTYLSYDKIIREDDKSIFDLIRSKNIDKNILNLYIDNIKIMFKDNLHIINNFLQFYSDDIEIDRNKIIIFDKEYKIYNDECLICLNKIDMNDKKLFNVFNECGHIYHRECFNRNNRVCVNRCNENNILFYYNYSY